MYYIGEEIIINDWTTAVVENYDNGEYQLSYYCNFPYSPYGKYVTSK